MAAIKSFYPEFVPNQVLTNTQLNQLREHLDQQDRLGLVRTVGTGKVCGLRWSKDGASHHLVLDQGYGISSDGYLIKVETDATFTHFRPYMDPDVDENEDPVYEPWRDPADIVEQIDILELLDTEVMSAEEPPAGAAPLTAATGADRVLVLYLEKRPVDLKSCLVTDCDNKGVNVNLIVRALLVRKEHLEPVAPCESPLPLARIPRLHTVVSLTAVRSGADINAGYSSILAAQTGPLVEKIETASRKYEKILDLDPLGPPATAFENRMTTARSSGQINQYHYDALKDVATAYNEAVSAACELVPECCPESSFPRHLMLGALDGTEGFDHAFAPSPVRNVWEGDLQRVRALFHRIGALCEHASFAGGNDVQITPSQTESHPLGSRALPFYYDDADTVKKLWQPRLCCTTDKLWSHRDEGESGDLDFEYNRSTLLRIEGHLALTCDTARESIRTRRTARNAELDVLCAFLDDARGTDGRFGELLAARRRMLGELRELIAKAAEAPASDRDEADERVLALAEPLVALNRRIRQQAERWASARTARELHCDVGSLRADYLAAREEILCVLHRLRGTLARIAEGLAARASSNLEIDGASGLVSGASLVLTDRIAVRFGARETVSGDARDELREALSVLRGDDASRLVWLAHQTALGALRGNLQRLLDEHLPKDLAALQYEAFVEKYGEVNRDLLYFVLLGMAYDLPPVDVTEEEEGSADDAPHPEEDALLHGDLLGGLRSCHHRGVAAAFIAYEQLREKDPSRFTNLAARVDGLEHLAGVERGGTFVLVCEPGAEGDRVVADFSLSCRLPCCCQLKPSEICLPPVASSDHRIVTLRPRPSGEGYRPVRLQIDVTGNDYDPNFQGSESETPLLEVSLESTETELGGGVDLIGNNMIGYELEDPTPGAVDRFQYTLKSSEEGCPGTSTGDVLILLLPERLPQTGTIDGTVFANESGGSAPGSTVELTGPVSATAVADAKANFSFSGLPPGDYRLQATFENRTSDQASVALLAGETVSVRLVLRPASGRIEGVVLRDQDAPVRNAEVVILETGVRVTSDANGRFGFEDLVPGTYRLQASLGGAMSEVATVRVKEGGTSSVELLLIVRVENGTVVIVLRDSTGGVLPGVLVSLADVESGGESFSREAATGNNGAAQFRDVPPNRYRATVSVPGMGSTTDDKIEVKSGEVVTREIVIGVRGVVIPDGFVNRLAEIDNIPVAEARTRAEVIYGERYTDRLSSLQSAARDPVVKSSTSYQRAEAFLVETLAEPASSDEALIAAYRDVSATLTRAVTAASPNNKDAYRDLLVNLSLGFMDRLTLTNPDRLGRVETAALQEMASNLKQAGVNLNKARSSWKSSRLATDLRIGSVEMMMEILR